jgi:hypothetical protein
MNPLRSGATADNNFRKKDDTHHLPEHDEHRTSGAEEAVHRAISPGHQRSH